METVTSKDGTTIAYDKLGAGPSLILVSGGSCDRMVDAGLANGLAEVATVYNYDRRGRGDSTDTLPYAVEREIEDLQALLDVTGRAAVLGLSSGAALTAHAAAAGLDFSHVVLWEAPYLNDEGLLARAKKYRADLAAALAQDDRDGAVALFMRQVGLPDEMIAGMKHSPYWEIGRRLALTLAYDAACLGDDRIPAETFAKIRAKTLVLDGDQSPAFMREAAAALAGAIPNAKAATLAGQDHDVQAAVLNPVLSEFLAS
ncbi:alpha/beta fold hydrolase [Tenggerimyces flavus]|uniref:Alpha/beta fold hydrolase n=1 Tax=Tenggerimyces flavus TaxID=1708749 RepID=A0ABV7Y635_9ACTN|nr:alpha/beta hydrolase [Tenggerimyces flavus]MBM7791254.1 pimeloyl-ACP methyl ester carboxylesterase [Tenggerimyces flavus]